MHTPVFICYSSKSRDTAVLLANYLGNGGIKPVWIDQEQLRPAQPIRATVVDGVRAACCCILILNQHSVESPWCMCEVGGFLALGKPVIVHPTEPGCAVPTHLNDIRFAQTLQEVLEACQRALASAPRNVLERAGVVNTFRIPRLDNAREERVEQLVQEELALETPSFKLAASSGYNYLHPQGKVWRMGLGDAILAGKAHITVVLQSPFSIFALARAVANDVVHQQWDDRGMAPQLARLATLPNVSLSVTWCPVNCSVFFTQHSVFYDPYIWGRPNPAARNENNFWVFEFRPETEPAFDCYHILEKHFEFLARESVPLSGITSDYEDLCKRFQRKVEQLRQSGSHDFTICV